MFESFLGGIHPKDGKELAKDKPIEDMPVPQELVVPMGQHIGAPCTPTVKVGDEVKRGQLIGTSPAFMHADIHAPVSGKVVKIEPRPHSGMGSCMAVVIQNDGKDEWADGLPLTRNWQVMENEEILAAIQSAGIVGMGGATFPAHIKLKPSKPVDILILNGAECEPYLTADYRLMLEHGEKIITGTQILQKLLDVKRTVIGIEDNKPEAIHAMEIAASGKQRISVRTMITKYPQGGERSLIQAVAGVDFPTSKLPADVGCVVQNVGTLYAIQRAVLYGEPLFSQCFTITGEAVAEPGNYMVRVGTSYAELLEAAGGVKEGMEIRKALSGGPMMGIAIGSLDIPIQTQNNGLTLLAEDPVEAAEAVMTSCLRCGRCTTVCPMGLTPQLMCDAAVAGDLERYEKKLYGMDCIQCGSCSFACPAKRPLTPTFKQAKAEILEKRKREGGAQK